MSLTFQNLVYVYYQASQAPQLMGRLLLRNRKIFFEYEPEFIKKNLELSPFKLPLKAGVIPSNEKTFEGLFGVFNDSLPDGWGRLLLDRKLIHAGLHPGSLSPLDRLCFVGSRGMGALTYQPENPHLMLNLPTDLEEIYSEIQVTLDQNDEYIDNLLILGGSSAGARPKVMLNLDNEDWLIKFRSSLDPEDIGAIEYAYHLMAKEAGLIVPTAKLFPSKQGWGFFGVKRFDRNAYERIHMHTVAGLLHADHRELSLDYESIMKATLYLTRDVGQCEVQFRNAVFNVLSHNRDDHSKNFAFLMDQTGNWTVSPAYDLTFSSGPSGEHSTLVMGEGRNPTQEHLLKLAAIGDIKESKALEIIHQVLEATQNWGKFASAADVSALQTQHIEKAFSKIHQNFESDG